MAKLQIMALHLCSRDPDVEITGMEPLFIPVTMDFPTPQEDLRCDFSLIHVNRNLTCQCVNYIQWFIIIQLFACSMQSRPAVIQISNAEPRSQFFAQAHKCKSACRIGAIAESSFDSGMVGGWCGCWCRFDRTFWRASQDREKYDQRNFTQYF